MPRWVNVNTNPPMFCLEATRVGRKIAMSISGIICISDYSEELILLKTQGGKIRLCGEKLTLKVCEGNTAEISGRVREIGFDYA